MSVTGLTCIGFVSLLLVIACSHPDSSFSARSSTRLGSLLLASDFVHVSLFFPLRSMAWIDLAASASNRVRLGLPISALDSGHLGSLSPLRSFACPGLVVLASDLLYPGPSSLLRSHLCVGFAALAAGLARAGLVFSPPVLYATTLELSMLPHSPA